MTKKKKFVPRIAAWSPFSVHDFFFSGNFTLVAKSVLGVFFVIWFSVFIVFLSFIRSKDVYTSECISLKIFLHMI